MREKLIELLESVPHPQRLYPDLYVDSLIANDVVPVVRCEKCKHWGEVYGVQIGIRFGYCSECNMHTMSDYFCAYGERVEEE